MFSGFQLAYMEGGDYKSLLVLVTSYSSRYHGEIYEVKIQKGSGQIMGGVRGAIGDEYGKDQAPLRPVTTIFKKNTYSIPDCCLCDGTDLFGGSKLYLLFKEGMQANHPHSAMTPDSLKGYVFDVQNKSFSTFQGPRVPKPLGNVISAYEKLYHLAIPVTSPYRPNDPESVFERYDPLNDSWEFLPPVPSVISDKRVEIVGYAIYNHHILLSLKRGPGYEFLAFHVRTQKWVHVKVEESHRMARSHFPFRGRAVVFGDRMYASSNSFGVVLEFSFDCEAYSLTPKLVFPRMKRMHLANMDIGVETEYLVHLGGWDFCLVQTAYDYKRIDRQPLWITTFRIIVGSGGSSNIEILHSTIRDVCIHGGWHFHVNFSFTP